MAVAGSKRYSDELKRDAVDMVEQLVAQPRSTDEPSAGLVGVMGAA